LSITPQVNEEGYITTTIRPEVSSIYSWVGDIPWVRVRQAETIVRVKNGETIVLGGLINT
jgi:type II secretory pathway component GspD/PulD (secretin)